MTLFAALLGVIGACATIGLMSPVVRSIGTALKVCGALAGIAQKSFLVRGATLVPPVIFVRMISVVHRVRYALRYQAVLPAMLVREERIVR